MKKVLFIITKSNWGGAQRYVYDLTTHLPKNEFDVSVALGGNGLLKERLNKAGIRTVPIPHLERDVNIIKELLSLKSLWNILMRENPDIVHLNSSKIGGLGAFIAKIYKLTIRHRSLITIFTVHGWAFNEDRSKWARYLIRMIQWATVLLCDRVIIISNRDFRQAIHLPLVEHKKFVLIPLGIPEENIEILPRVQARKELSALARISLQKRFLIGTVAELTKNKGLIYLIDAIHKLSTANYQLQTIIIGEGEERKKLEKQITSFGLENTVYLSGFIPDASRYLRAFDLFISASLKEGLPYTLIEAMHAERPIIGTRVGGIPDLIEQEGTGIVVQPKDTNALAGAMQKFLDNEQLRHSFGKAGKKRAKNRFSFAAMLAYTIAIYKE